MIGPWRVAGLLTVTLVLAGGQLLFKLAAERLVLGRGARTLALSFVSVPMIWALLLYGAATVLWVYLLHGLPLSRAYPFIGLVFALVPLMGWIVFGEGVDARYFAGLALLLAGLYLIASGR